MSKIGLPNIDITFVQKAVSAIDRSERGVLAIVCFDSNAESVTKNIYKYETDIVEENYDAENLTAIKRAFLVAVNKVYVISVPKSDSAKFADAVDVLNGIKFNYICVLDAQKQQDLVDWIITKNANSAGKKYIAVVCNAGTADSKYVINLKGTTVTEVGSTTTLSMAMYLPRIASILCNLPLNRSITYYELEDLEDVDTSYVTTEQDLDSWINQGFLCLFVDEDVVKVARGVNTLTTFTSTDTEDMRKIIIVEGMNLIIEDIYNTFKDYYVGKYKNSYDNQALFISSINAYFRQLMQEEILDPNYENTSYVDIEAQRNAWLAVGKTAAEDWDDVTVKNMTFKSYVYLAGQVKILDAIEDLKFTITMA